MATSRRRKKIRKQKKIKGKRTPPIKANPLARAVTAAKRSKKRETITAAMKRSQRASAEAGGALKRKTSSSASVLIRTVKAAKRQRKKDVITAALKRGRRRA
ncbi:hypothetical protein [Petrachloros mirabilis]